MDTARQFSILLPEELAEAVESIVRSGRYASVSDVVHDGLRALLEQDSAVDQWLREEVAAGHQAFVADPASGLSADQILARVKRRGGRSR